MSGILAGLFIGIGYVVNLQVKGIAGAIFFSVGLLAVLMLNCNLCTGKMGYLIGGEVKLRQVAEYWIENFIGVCLPAFYVWSKGLEVPIAKANFLGGILCGVLVYVAVYSYKQCEKPVSVVAIGLGIGAFILSGYQHCVAYMCNMVAARAFGWVYWLSLAEISASNLLGAILVPLFKKIEKVGWKNICQYLKNMKGKLLQH